MWIFFVSRIVVSNMKYLFDGLLFKLTLVGVKKVVTELGGEYRYTFAKLRRVSQNKRYICAWRQFLLNYSLLDNFCY